MFELPLCSESSLSNENSLEVSLLSGRDSKAMIEFLEKGEGERVCYGV